MTGHKNLIYPVIFAVFVLVLAPVFIIALLTYDPGGASSSSDCAALPAVHIHGAALISTVQDDMQLILNVGPAAQLYTVVGGELALCGGDASGDEMKHVTVDVNDARLVLGERLPVMVEITLRRQDSGVIVLQAGAPAMYSPGHGYHFGDNFRVPNGAIYDWEITVSPVKALRQEGTQTLWLEPVTWTGSFELAADGRVIGKAASPQKIREFVAGGIHVMLSTEDARPLYAVTDDGATVRQEFAPDSRYFVVDVTDHTVNYEEKLPGAQVIVTFRTQGTTIEVPFEPVISPVYGFHYGANVALTPGRWQITVKIADLDFWRHADITTDLVQKPVSDTFIFAVE